MGELHAFDLNPFFSKFKTKIYFETGTGKAVSLKYALQYPFLQYYSVDIDTDLATAASSEIDRSDVKIINNYSSKALEEYLPLLNKKDPILFFLDAHFPGADFHKISYEESIRTYKRDAFPLEEEIKIILKNRDPIDVIIIDDFMLYENHDYECLKVNCSWQYKWLQEELNLNTDSAFIYESFKNTHDFSINLAHQGYLVITPKNGVSHE